MTTPASAAFHQLVAARRGHFLLESGHHGAITVVAGALLVLGRTGADHFERLRLPVVSVAAEPYDSWLPDCCPLCAAGTPLERVAGG